IVNLGPRAMQNPGLVDWRLSPASFAANPHLLIGDDDAETLLPAPNLSLYEFHFFQSIRLTDLNNEIPAQFVGKVALGIANDYQLVWFPLGHSLGQILYSLPLAPGESVKLAVIDWTRRDTTARTE